MGKNVSLRTSNGDLGLTTNETLSSVITPVYANALSDIGKQAIDDKLNLPSDINSRLDAIGASHILGIEFAKVHCAYVMVIGNYVIPSHTVYLPFGNTYQFQYRAITTDGIHALNTEKLTTDGMQFTTTLPSDKGSIDPATGMLTINANPSETAIERFDVSVSYAGYTDTVHVVALGTMPKITETNMCRVRNDCSLNYAHGTGIQLFITIEDPLESGAIQLMREGLSGKPDSYDIHSVNTSGVYMHGILIIADSNDCNKMYSRNLNNNNYGWLSISVDDVDSDLHTLKCQYQCRITDDHAEFNVKTYVIPDRTNPKLLANFGEYQGLSLFFDLKNNAPFKITTFDKYTDADGLV